MSNTPPPDAMSQSQLAAVSCYWRTMPERCAGLLAIVRQVLMSAGLA